MSIDADLVEERVAALRDLIDRRATRPVRIVAVTKRFGPEAVAAAAAAGVHDIGENYAQELLEKAAEVEALDLPPVRWHFIGHVQRNKVRGLAPVVAVWQTVDSVRLGTEIAKRAPGASVLVQVNMSGAETQSGVARDAVAPLVEQLRRLDLGVEGLMQIGALGDPDRTQAMFHDLRALADGLELVECSMGMSADLEAALTAGSTMVRVGTGLFGPRPS